MQAITRRFGHKAVNQSSSISSLRSLYPISDHHCYGADFPRFASTLAPMGTSHLLRRGTGGRSSVSGIIATVFGATGFLGRYVVQQLAKMGSQVLVPFRGSEDSHRHLKVMGDLGQIVPMKYDPRDESSIKAVMAKANVVVNLIGRDYATRNYSFDQVNYHMAEQLAQISKEHGGIMRFIQVSCLGASPSAPSKMLRAKAAAEESIMRELPEATIMKPAVMVGTEDRILNRWAAFAKKYGFLPLIGDGSTKIQPVYVVDVAAAIVAALRDDGSSMGKVFELGGPDIYTIHELAELMHETIREYSRYVHVPVPIAKAIAMPRELLLNKVPFPLPTPEMVNLDTVDAITTDTLVSGNAVKPSSGPHKARECLPLLLIIRDRLKYALTYNECVAILMQRHILVDGKVRTDKKYPSGFMDVISIPKTNENFRLLYDTKGRFRLHSILKEEEAKYKNTTEAAVAGAKSIAMSSIKSGTVRRLIYTASVAAYSPLKNNGSGYKEFMDETCSTPLDLVCSSSNDFFTAYTDSKTLAEKEILSYSSGNFEVVTLACGLVGGDTVISYTPTSVAMYVSQITNNAVAYQGLKYGFLKLKHGGGIEPKTKEVSTEDDVIIGGNQSIWL